MSSQHRGNPPRGKQKSGYKLTPSQPSASNSPSLSFVIRLIVVLLGVASAVGSSALRSSALRISALSCASSESKKDFEIGCTKVKTPLLSMSGSQRTPAIATWC